MRSCRGVGGEAQRIGQGLKVRTPREPRPCQRGGAIWCPPDPHIPTPPLNKQQPMDSAAGHPLPQVGLQASMSPSFLAQMRQVVAAAPAPLPWATAAASAAVQQEQQQSYQSKGRTRVRGEQQQQREQQRSDDDGAGRGGGGAVRPGPGTGTTKSSGGLDDGRVAVAGGGVAGGLAPSQQQQLVARFQDQDECVGGGPGGAAAMAMAMGRPACLVGGDEVGKRGRVGVGLDGVMVVGHDDARPGVGWGSRSRAGYGMAGLFFFLTYVRACLRHIHSDDHPAGARAHAARRRCAGPTGAARPGQVPRRPVSAFGGAVIGFGGMGWP